MRQEFVDIINRISMFMDSTKDEIVIKNNLSSKDRSLIHELCKKHNLHSESKEPAGISKTVAKDIIIKKNHPITVKADSIPLSTEVRSHEMAGPIESIPLSTEVRSHELAGPIESIITTDFIKYFAETTKIPIPVPITELLNYYLDILDEYYGAKHAFDKLLKDVRSAGSLGKYKQILSSVQTAVSEFITSHSEFQELTKSNFDVPNVSMKNTIYNNVHAGFTFVSIDIKSANFRVIKEFCPTMFPSEWTEFLKRYTDYESILNNKMFREILFGRIGATKKTQRYALIFVDEIDKALSGEDYYKDMEKVMCMADEIVYKRPEDFCIINLRKKIESIRPNFFHVRMFKLKKIGGLNCYVKIHDDGKKELKAVESKFAVQCIKFLKGEKIVENDRKFMDNGMIATYDKSLFDL
jgi:hypothetical protein